MINYLGLVMDNSTNKGFDFKPGSFSNQYLLNHVNDIICRLKT